MQRQSERQIYGKIGIQSSTKRRYHKVVIIGGNHLINCFQGLHIEDAGSAKAGGVQKMGRTNVGDT